MVVNQNKTILDYMEDVLANASSAHFPQMITRHVAFDATVLVISACCLILAPICLRGYNRLVFTTRATLFSLKAILALGFTLGWYGKVICEPVEHGFLYHSSSLSTWNGIGHSLF